MAKNDLISEISDKNVDVDKFAEIVINKEPIRHEIINQMLNNTHIMVYYHSYNILAKASELKPELFYKYWDDFASLLNHENSYHRDFGLTLIANLTKVDFENKFSSVSKNYFKHINDAKFMTARHCIQNTAKIMANKSGLTEDILDILLNIDEICNFSEKQKALLKSDIIYVFDEFYEQIDRKEMINKFVKVELNSISPKTKKIAREFILKYEI
ncbi:MULTISPECIES: hypothetical protein [Methanobacterium]|uniref:Uncharacterized protein n=1 Tax=Methanobacterium veterum TaxID=408577 RepID=A0A9E5DK38_9EURY|nr:MULTISPECIES: hypothetical protein [Methanobacterium]MCZ3365204.1 hypothetical protein [Methanobacterium veterum]MCZ3372959.1 hypothetical protein [Methanobacterium veterum]